MKILASTATALLSVFILSSCQNNKPGSNDNNNESELGTDIDVQSETKADSTAHHVQTASDTAASPETGNAVESSLNNPPEPNPQEKR